MNYDVLHNFISPVTGRVLSDPDYVLVGNDEGVAVPSPILIDVRLELNNLRQTIKNMQLPELKYKQIWTADNNNKVTTTTKLDIDNLPDLTSNKVWQGDETGRPQEVELQIAPSEASYIIQIPDLNLPNAQALAELGTGIAKVVEGGAIAIAVPDEDYATKETLEKIRDETERFRDEAEYAADEANIAAEGAGASAAAAAEAASLATGAAGVSILGGAVSVLDNIFGGRGGAFGGAGGAVESTDSYRSNANNFDNNIVNSNEINNNIYNNLSDNNFSLTEQNIKNSNLRKIAFIEQSANQLQNNVANNIDNIEDSLQQITQFTDFINRKSRDVSIYVEAANESSFIAEGAAQQASYYLSTLNNSGITLTGDITGKGSLNSAIVTSFKQNPKFYGVESIQIPFGGTSDRPNEANIGMLRYNTDYETIEYYNNSIWAQIESNSFAITYPYATDMIYGVISNVNGLFDGFSSLERDLDIKIKSSYYTGELNDISSASLSLLDRYNNGYINKTISSNTGYFDYLLQKQDDGIKTDLLKFDNKIDEFIFHKPISYNGKNIIKYDEAVDIVTGVLNNSNGLFSGFATDNQEIDLKIKTAYFVQDDYSTSSLSFLNRYNNGYIFSNKTNSDWSNEFSFNITSNEIKTELFKYDSISNKFVFNKLVEVPYPINDADAVNKLYVDSVSSGFQEVLGTDGQINSSGGNAPQISLANSGVVSGNYVNSSLNVDDYGRITSITSRNYIENIEFNDNEISVRGFNPDLTISPNRDLIIKSDTIIKNNSSLKIYDELNIQYTDIQPPYQFDSNITWKLPKSKPSQNQFLKMGSNDQLEWSNINTGITSITAGNGLTGGTITSSGTIGIQSSGVSSGTYVNPTINIGEDGRITSASNGQAPADIANFIFTEDTIATNKPFVEDSIYIDTYNLRCLGAGYFQSISFFGSGSNGFIRVDVDGYLYFTNSRGTHRIAG